MKTVSDEEWMSYLAKSKAKKLQPDNPTHPDDLLILGGTEGSKRKRRGDRARPSQSHSTSVIQTEDVQMGEFVDGGVTVQTAVPPPAVVGVGSSVWGSSFDPAASSVVCPSGQRNSGSEFEDEVDHLKKAHQEELAEVRGAHACEIAGLRKKHAAEKTSLRTKAAIRETEVTNLDVLHNNLIVSLTQAGKDVWELVEDVDELEETNVAFKQSMADKYVDGFWSSIEQVKVLFPELDPDMLAQVDVMKRIKDGKHI
ncbi:hypothetical protein TSUD_279880 [Trifolium subterraneum]|uniref:Uncharacterized protein n=1 Tax=Trifolium subterraneum TaxID=3900 RepID=A0A2Z6LZF9_TRISU|nr:hypothetical protein TSUD_279880 [Trifolium subterraneum]